MSNDPELPLDRPRKKLTDVQKHRMLKFIEQHPRLKTGVFDYSFTVGEGRRLWQELANILNSLDGPKKSWLVWKKCYRDMKSVRQSAGRLEYHSRSMSHPNFDSSAKNEPSSDESNSDEEQSIDNPVDKQKFLYKRIGDTSVRKIPQNPIPAPRMAQPSTSASASRPTSTTVQPKKLVVRKETKIETTVVPDEPDTAQPDYYKRKLDLMERQTLAFEAMAESMQMQAEAFYDLTESVNSLNSILKDLNIR